MGSVPVGPSASILQCLRQVPVIEGHVRLDPRGVQLVDQATVEIETIRIWSSHSTREDAWPGDREPIASQTKIAHQRNVSRVTMVVIAGDVASVTVGYLARSVAECIPDRRPTTVLPHRPFNLIG